LAGDGLITDTASGMDMGIMDIAHHTGRDTTTGTGEVIITVIVVDIGTLTDQTITTLVMDYITELMAVLQSEVLRQMPPLIPA